MSVQAFETLLRRTANHFGIDICRYRPERSAEGRLSMMLKAHHVDVVLDVGANSGQFAQSLRRSGYGRRIVSFEPLSGAHSELLRNSHGDSDWEVADRLAIGDYDGEIDMRVAANSVSSSALPMMELHERAASGSAAVGIERVKLKRLDSIADSYLTSGAVPFLKIDTQGFEDRVLDGTAKLLDRIVGLQLELSFVPLYEGQQLFSPMLERLCMLGFAVWGIWPGFHDPGSGRMLQVDVVFFRGYTALE